MGYNSLLQGKGAIRVACPPAGIKPTTSRYGFFFLASFPAPPRLDWPRIRIML